MKGKRNLTTYAQAGKGRISSSYCLRSNELTELYNLATTDLFKAIATAFYVGVEAGYRSAVKKGKAK